MQTRRYQIEWMLLATVLLVLGALIGYWLYEEHNRVEAREQDRLQVQARVVDENLGRQLEGANNALAGVRDEFPMPVGKYAAQAASRHLKALIDAMPGVRTMLLVDAGGTVLASSRDEFIGFDASERKYFTVARDRPDPAILYVSTPFTTTLGVFAINLVRVVTGPGGEFAGIVSATLDPSYFNVVLRSVIYAPDMRAAVAHGEGIGFLYIPPNDSAAGLDLAVPGSFFSRHRESGQIATVMTGTTYATGEARMVAVRTLERADLRMDKPLIVAISRDLEAIYLSWLRQALAYGVTYAVSAAAAILGLYFFQKRERALDQLGAAQENERRENAERLELALAGADLGLWDWHVPSGTGAFNARWCEILGYAPDELAPNASTWRERVHPDDWPVIHAALDPHLNGETPNYEAEHRMRHRDGRWIWVLGRGKVMERDAAGAPVRMLGTLMDIAERKLAAVEREQFFKLFTVSLDLMCIVGLDGYVKRVNPAVSRILGYSENQLLQRPYQEFAVPEDRQAVQSELERRSHRGTTRDFEVRFLCKDGSIRYLLWSAFFDSEEQVIYATAHDITNRRRNEQELQRNAAELKHAYRRLAQAQEAERRALTKELHDQVGQTLSALNLNLQYIDRELSGAGHDSLKKRLADCLELLDETVTRIRDVMGNLRPPMLDEFGLFATLRWWAHETSQRSGIPCTLVGQDLAPRPRAELETALLRIAQEALMNAAKYSNASEIRIALTATAQQVRMEIADDGVGFEAPVRNAVDNNPTWGLAMMRERADALGGRVEVISAPGVGTRVVAEMPSA